MSRPRKDLPRYCLHKQSGRAYVTLEGRQYLLPGKHGSAESRRAYDRLIAEWLASGRTLLPSNPGDGTAPVPGVTVARLVAMFWQHAKRYYRHPDGTPTREADNFRAALRPLVELYSGTPAGDFGPLKLKALRERMIARGWCRTQINRNIGRIKMVFRWAVENQLVPPGVYHGLQAVAGLRAGRSDAKESTPVRPVPEPLVEATLPYLSPTVAAMVRLQLLTGMRPGEVCAMRGCDLDTGGKLWLYRPNQHKTLHHGHTRTIYIGPKAQEVLRPFLKSDVQAYLFSPQQADRECRAVRSAKRKTSLSCGNRPGSNRKRKPRRAPGQRYDVDAYRRAIARACERAFRMPPELAEPRTLEAIRADTPQAKDLRRERRRKWRQEHTWHPHQLRHTAATRLRQEYGLEAAQVILGHKTLTVTQVYAEKNIIAAQKIMAEAG